MTGFIVMLNLPKADEASGLSKRINYLFKCQILRFTQNDI